MTIDELWQNLQPYMQKFDKLEAKVNKLEPLVGKFDKLEAKVNKLEPLVGKFDKLEAKVNKLEPIVGEVQKIRIDLQKVEKELKDQVKDLRGDVHGLENYIKGELHIIKNVNMAKILEVQLQMMEELERINKELGKHIQKNEVQHKKFEYEIVDLKYKVAN